MSFYIEKSTNIRVGGCQACEEFTFASEPVYKIMTETWEMRLCPKHLTMICEEFMQGLPENGIVKLE